MEKIALLTTETIDNMFPVETIESPTDKTFCLEELDLYLLLEQLKQYSSMIARKNVMIINSYLNTSKKSRSKSI